MDYNFNKKLLKRVMKEKKISREQLAALLTDAGLDISLSGVNYWFRDEKNKPEIDKAKAISEILNIPFSELVEQSIFTTSNTQTTYGGNNTNIQGNNNTINIENDELDELPNKEKFTTPKFREFLQLYSCYGNEKMLDPIIDKIKKAKEILEN